MHCMIEVSKKFKKAVYAPTRSTTARVRFELLDTDAFTDNEKVVSSEAIISRKDQLTNKIRSMSARMATFEKDYFKLDGLSVFSPQVNELPEIELGWWSDELCNVEGVFTTPPTVEFRFSEEHSSAGLTVYFDVLNGEYATDFEIEVFNLSDELIAAENITNNNQSRFIWINQLTDYAKIIITIKKWCKGYRRAKVVEVDFGVIKEYMDDNLIKLNVIQELDTVSNTLPADELRFTVDNANREFNLLNPNGFYAYLQQGQECFAEIGVEVSNGVYEFVQVGKFYLKEWQIDEGTLTASFTARDVLDMLSNDETENLTVRDLSLYDLAVETLTASGIENYSLSNNLKLIRTNGLYNKLSYRELLQRIAVAGMCVVYADNFGHVHMKQLLSVKTVIESIDIQNQAVISNKDQVINNVLEPTDNFASFERGRFKLDGSLTIPQEDMSNYEVGWWSSDISNNDGTFAGPLILEVNISKDHISKNFEILFDVVNNEYATEFELIVYDENNNVMIDETINNTNARCFYENNLLENSRKMEIIIKKWSKGNRRARIIEIGFDIPVDNLTFDNIYNDPQIELSGSVKAVEVTYYPIGLENGITYTTVNPNVKNGSVLKLDNSLINSEQDARNVTEWVLKEHEKFATFKVDWRQNPALLVSDKIGIENGYGGNNIAYITKQEYEYQGYLTGKTEAKGGI